MKKLILLALLAAGVYYGYIKINKPDPEKLREALPVAMDPSKGRELVERAERVKDKANAAAQAVSDLKKEITEP